MGIRVGGKVSSSGSVTITGIVQIGEEIDAGGKVSIRRYKKGILDVGGKISAPSGCMIEGDLTVE